MWLPLGKYLMQRIPLVCPIHFNGGAGHDNIFLDFVSIPLVKCVLKVVDKWDCEGKKGRVEI